MKLLLVSLLLPVFLSCGKSNDAPAPAPKAAKITIESASVVNISGANMLELKLSFVNSSYVQAATITIYKTDINSISYKYAIAIKEGEQILDCSKYADSSPMQYQIKYEMKTGSVTYTGLLNQSF